MRILLIIFLIFIVICKGFGQSAKPRPNFSTVFNRITYYKRQQFMAHKANQEQEVVAYADSVNQAVVSTRTGKYKFKTFDNKLYKTADATKPYVIITSATWCTPCRYEIPAINKLAAEYAGKVDFIIIFGNEKKELTALVMEYEAGIYLVPCDGYATAMHIDVGGFEYSGAYPSAFFVAANGNILKFKEGATVATASISQQQAYSQNYQSLKAGVELLLAKQP